MTTEQAKMDVLAIGEVLWDIFPSKEHLGGAALNFCANLARLGDAAHLITAVGDDDQGQRAIHQMAELGIDTSFVQRTSAAPTGIALVGEDAEGHPSFSIRRPAAYDQISLTDALLGQLSEKKPRWIYFGTLFNVEERNESLTRALLQTVPTARGFYDMNLRPGQWNVDLVHRLCSLASMVKLNEQEVRIFAESDNSSATAENFDLFCERLCERFDVATVCITLGSQGCFVYAEGKGQHIQGYSVEVRDTVGAGDAFAAAFLHGCDHGLPMKETAKFANAVGALIASKDGALHPWTRGECLALCR